MERSTDRGPWRSSRLFSGASGASRCFELGVLAAGVALAARTIAVAPPGLPVPAFVGLEGGIAAILAVVAITLTGAFPLPLGNKTYLSLGSGAAFATLLMFSPQQALPLAFAGTLVAQILRRHRGYRLSAYTVLFNQAQYLVTWSLCAALYVKARADLAAHPAVSAWLPVLAVGVVYVLINTWLVSTWNALRKRTWPWDLWIRMLREAGPGFAGSLAIGAVVARLAAIQPLWVFPPILALAATHWGLSRMSRIRRRESSAVLTALVDFGERLSPFTTERSERVAWWAERLARHLGLTEDEVEAVAVAAKVHDLGEIMLRHLEEKPGPLTQRLRAAGRARSFSEERAMFRQHPAIGADVIARVPGMETVARYVRSHHERYDGNGYPDGLCGEEIPAGARIIAVADRFDALVEPQADRPARSHQQALAEIVDGAGTQFDSRVVSAFQTLVPEPADGPRTASLFPRTVGILAAGETGVTLPPGGPAGTWTQDDAGGGSTGGRPSPASQALSNRAVAAVEAERRHIARELHDEIGQALTGLKLTLETVPQAPAQTAGARLREAQEAITELMARVRNLSLDLRPAMLDDLGLLPALLWHIERYTSQTGVRVAFEHAGLDRRMGPEVETAAYRIAQEALTNIARHAGVREAGLRVWTAEGTLYVQVADRGTGFNPGFRNADSPRGVAGMRERALQLGGRLRIESAPGSGTRVTADLPLGAPDAATDASD